MTQTTSTSLSSDWNLGALDFAVAIAPLVTTFISNLFDSGYFGESIVEDEKLGQICVRKSLNLNFWRENQTSVSLPL